MSDVRKQKKSIAGVLGLLFLVMFFYNKSYQSLLDRSSAEIAGYNIWSLFELVGGILLLRYSVKKKTA